MGQVRRGRGGGKQAMIEGRGREARAGKQVAGGRPGVAAVLTLSLGQGQSWNPSNCLLPVLYLNTR